MKTVVLTWDWKESPGQVIADIMEALSHEFQGEPLCAREHPTGCDDYCLVLSSEPMTAEDAKKAFEGRWDEGDEL